MNSDCGCQFDGQKEEAGMGIVASTITEYYREEGRIEAMEEWKAEMREQVKLLMKQGFSELDAYRQIIEL